MDIEKFFKKLFIDAELADNICHDLNISRKEYSKFAKHLKIERKNEIQIIRRVRSLYHHKKNLNGFNFQNFNSFFNWYKIQFQQQKGKCYYCKTDENVIATLFEKIFQNRKRTTRGKYLEVERRDSIDNLYNSENCVLACYFCNNDKSDIFDESQYFDYLKDRNTFFINQYRKINSAK